jgi:hypothetical protein
MLQRLDKRAALCERLLGDRSRLLLADFFGQQEGRALSQMGIYNPAV